MIHRINVFILSLLIAISPIILMNQANAAVGGWTMSNPVAQGASTAYDGAKQVIIDGKNYIKKGTAVITPTATGVAKVLARGAAGYALSVAVEQLLGSVDWVLDPANNQIRYTPHGEDPGVIDQYDYSHWMLDFTWFATLDLAINALERKNNWECRTGTPRYQVICVNNKGTEVFRDTFARTGKVITLDPPEEKTLPLPVVAAQVISNAAGGDVNAQAATTAAAADIVAEAETDNTKARPIAQQLEASAQTKPVDEAAAAQDATATGTVKPQVDPVTGEAAPPTDIALKFPMLCGLMPIVCEAAQVVVVRVPEAIESVKEWVKIEEPVQKETKVDIEPSPVAPSETNYLQWNAYCPFSAKSDDISLNGENSTLSSDLTSWCTMASEIKPFVLLAGALASLMIVSGVGLGRSED